MSTSSGGAAKGWIASSLPLPCANALRLSQAMTSKLLNHVEFDLCDPAFNHPERVGRGF